MIVVNLLVRRLVNVILNKNNQLLMNINAGRAPGDIIRKANQHQMVSAVGTVNANFVTITSRYSASHADMAVTQAGSVASIVG